jgi:hypothetical protein
MALSTPVQAQVRNYAVAAGDLKSALDAWARQSGRQVIYKSDDVRAAQSAGARGSLSADAALQAILSGTGFAARFDSSSAVAIVPSPAPGEANAGSAAAATGSADVIVTGSRIRTAVTSSPVTTITREQIKQGGYSDLGEVARAIPQNFNGGQNPTVLLGTADVRDQNVTGGSGLDLRGLGPTRP